MRVLLRKFGRQFLSIAKCRKIPKDVRGHAKKCQFPSISVKKCQKSPKGGKVASVAHDLAPLYIVNYLLS